MSDSDAERQRKLKAGRAKLLEFKQMKKKKKKEEGAKAASSQSLSQKNSQSGSQSISKELPRTSSQMSVSKEASNTHSDGDQDTENDAASLSSIGNSNPASPIPHEAGDISYTSDSEYTSAEESYTYSDDGGVDSFVVANLERNELKNRVIELEENLRGKQAVMKELNKENYELRAKLQTFQSGSRQESSPSPVLRRELESLQDTLRENQKRLEEINTENHDMRAKLAHTGQDEKSTSSKMEEFRMTLESKQQMLEALNVQNQELINENNLLKSRQREKSPDNSQSDSQVESLQESLKTKQTVLSELNKQNQELREKIHELAQSGSSDNQAQVYKRKVGDLQVEMGLKDDEIERLKAVEISFIQMKEVMKELSSQSTQAKADLEEMKKRCEGLEVHAERRERECLANVASANGQLEKVQSAYHDIIAANNDHLMKIQILESQISTLENNLEEKDNKIADHDTEVSLAVGERDAVQLEARTQVEDLESRIKTMQEQLIQNGNSIRDYEAEISKASEELAISRDLVTESERILDEKNQQIAALEKKVEVVAGNDSQFENERKIYQGEIEGLRSRVEECQKVIADANGKLAESQNVAQKTLTERESKIDELLNERIKLERKHTEEVDNLQAHYDNLLKEQKEESKMTFEGMVEKLEHEKRDCLKDAEENFESKMSKMKAEFEKSKYTEVEELRNALEAEQQAKIASVQEEVTTTMAQQNMDEIIQLLKEKDEHVALLEESIKSKAEELEGGQLIMVDLKIQLSEKCKDVATLEERLQLEADQCEVMKVDLSTKIAELEEMLNQSNTELANVKVASGKYATECDLLKEKITELLCEKENVKKDFEIKTFKLKEDYEKELERGMKEMAELRDTREKDKIEFLQFVKDCEIVKEQLQERTDSETILKKTVESMEMKNEKLNCELIQAIEEKELGGDLMKKLRNENESLTESLKKISEERKENSKEYEAEVQMLKEKIEMIKSENNDEMIDGFNQSMDNVKQEKDEQIRNLKEEITHVREANDKYVQKMQSDFDSDMKHVEDENHNLKEELKELKEAKDKETSSLESNLKIELEAVQESHQNELADWKLTVERKLEEEQLKLKENHWHQLKRYEAEREFELRRLVEEGEKSKLEALEMLRQQLEEEKHREVHDVVCNMSKEQKESEAELRAEMERQLKKGQDERDVELRNMKQEYASFKESKKLEVEDLVSSQMSKYQEEQETLKKRLHKAEGRIRKLTSERDEFSKKERDCKQELENLQQNLANGEGKIESLLSKEQGLLKQLELKEKETENERRIMQEREFQAESKSQSRVPLMNLFEEMRREIHNISQDGEISLSPNLLKEKGLGRSFDESSSHHIGEASLDRELNEITRLCKGEIVDLAYKLKSLKSRYEDREKEFSEISVLNETLKEEVDKLEVELKKSHEQEDSANVNQGKVFPEVENVNREGGQKSFDVIDGSFGVNDVDYMTEKLQELSEELQLKMKMKDELDTSLSEMKSEINRVKSENLQQRPVVVEQVSAVRLQHEEAIIIPEILEQLETLPTEEFDALKYDQQADEKRAETEPKEEALSKDMALELKHLQKLLFDSNEKQEKQKKEINELRDALENERTLFAEQLRTRVAKETEAREAFESHSSESALREKNEALTKIAMLEQCLNDKELYEKDLKDENWRLVNLLKENNVELFTEKELLQEQLEKQENIIKELQQQMSTGDLVSNDIQEAFGRQLAALHRQRDALIEQLEQHKKEHRGYAKVVQEKAVLEERLREEKKILTEKLRQKEALEMELSAERSALNEKLIELEKLREMLNGKEKLTEELTDQRNELKMELTAIEDRLRRKEEDLSYEREELERELSLKDVELRKWEEDFKARESQLMEHEESLRQNFTEILEATRSDFEVRNEENLRQLRNDLDADHRQRILVTESGLHDRYSQEMTRVKEDHDNQLCNWLDLSEWLLDSMLSLPFFKMNRAKGEFEQKLLDLRRQLEEERLRQVKTVKNVLEREYSKEMMDIGKGHEVNLDELRQELEEFHQQEIERVKWEYEEAQNRVMEDLQASLITESAIRVGAARLGAEQEVERQLREMQAELDRRLEERLKEIEDEKETAVRETKEKCEKEMREKVDEVMREMQAEKEAEIEKLVGDNSIEDKIRFFERQISSRRDAQRIQASVELDTRHENEMEKVKSELVQKCGDDDEMFHALGEFESVQENYFQEKLQYVQEEHEVHIESVVKEYEILLLKTKNELDILREEDFQRIRRLQDEIYAKEEQILELKKSLEDETERLEQERREERDKHEKEIAKKNDDQVALLSSEKTVWENEKGREIAMLKMQFDGWLVQKDHELEMRVQEVRAMCENEMARREMEFIQREEIIKANYGQNQTEARIQILENEHCEKLREEDAKHREELEQAVIQLSSNLKEDFNKIMADLKASHEEEKAQMKKDFKKVKRDALDDLREELASDYNIQMKEMRGELEHDKVADIAKATTQISMKNAVDLENLREELKEKFEKELDAIKNELQKDFEMNALRQAAEIEELEIRHAEELREARRRIPADEREAIRREIEEEFSMVILTQTEQIEELERKHAAELRSVREKYDREEAGVIHGELGGDLAHNAIMLARQMEELETKHADEMRRLRQKYERDELDGTRREMREEFVMKSPTPHPPLRSDQIQELELKHEEDLKHIKHRYEELLAEKTQELQSEVNLLKSLLEGSKQQLWKMSQDSVDAVPTAPPFHEMDPGDMESLIVPKRQFQEGITPSASTETLIPRFRDGDILNALNDAYRGTSSDDASHFGTSSLSGSVPSLPYPSGARYPVARHEGGDGHDEVEQNQEAVLNEMRRRWRPSDSDSGRSYDQMMEPCLEDDEQRISKLMAEKESEMRDQLSKQKEDLENLYQERIHNLEGYIHSMHMKHEHEVNVLKEKSLQLAEEKLNEVKEEAAIEKVHIRKEAHVKLENSQKELNEKNDKLLKKFITEQEKLTEELKNDHIDELAMLKHELMMKHEREVKALGEKHSKFVLETRDRYEKLLKDERVKFERKHAEDSKKLKHLMDRSLEEKQKDLVNVFKDQHGSDLDHIKQSFEDDKRRIIDELTKDHMVQIDRVKENEKRELQEKFESEKDAIRENARREYDEYMRRDLTEKVYFEIERARGEAQREYQSHLQNLENQLEELHIQKMQTLQELREKHKDAIEELKGKHKEEMENATKSHEEVIQRVKDDLLEENRVDANEMEMNIEKGIKKWKEDIDEIHSKELDSLKMELTAARSKLTALEEAKSVSEKTYIDTIQKLHEDYENEIAKLKKAVEKYRQEELDKHDKNVADIYNTDQRILKQNFEQQISELKKHYEMILNDVEKKFEVEKREWLEQHVEKYEKKMEEIKKMYEDERKDLHNELINLDDEHTRQMDSLMDKVKSLTAELNTTRLKTTELSSENVELTNKIKLANDQYNTLVGRHERQEEENSKYIAMISSDVEKCEKEKSSLRERTDRILMILSNAVRASILIEDVINRHLDGLIQETSRTESGAGDSGANGHGRRRGNGPSSSLRAKFFGGSPKKSKADKTFGDSDLADWTQYSNLSGGSLHSDEGLDLSFISKEKLFTGSELDANGEEIVRGAGERLHTAVEQILRMLTVATRQTHDVRQAYEEALTRTDEAESHQRTLREEIADELKKALEKLEKEEKLKKEWENDARKKNSQVQTMNKESDELKQKIDEITKENKEKDSILRNAEERCLELEAEKEILVKLKNDLELKLAEFRTHRDNEAHGIRRENEDLKAKLTRAGEITGEELRDVLVEIEELREMVGTLSDEKEDLKEQLKDMKNKELKTNKEVDLLKRGNIEILQTNRELLEQNEELVIRSKTLEYAFEETLEERSIPQDEASSKEFILDDVDGGIGSVGNAPVPGPPAKPSRSSRGDGGSPYKEVLKLQDEIKELKDVVEILKEKNEMLCVELDRKHETELDLLNKISDLEDDLYRSAQEGFESEREDKGTFPNRKRNAELNLKRVIVENEKLKEDIEKKDQELNVLQDDLRKSNALVADRNSIFDELKTTKNMLAEKDDQFGRLVIETDLIKATLFSKEGELSTNASELFELKETIGEQRSTIKDQDQKILELLQEQDLKEKTEEEVEELVLEIRKEREMVVEKDNEIQDLLEKLQAKKSKDEKEDSEAKSKKVKLLQEELSQKEKEIKKLKKLLDANDEKQQELEQAHEVRLQKTIRHIKTELEEENQRQMQELKAEHQSEMDRMLETSRVEQSELGQRFEEQIGAAERVNLHLLENFFKNRTLNESQLPTVTDENAPVESLLNELQSEAEKIASLVTSYQLNGNDPTSIEALQNSWAKEKQILLEAVKALRELVARASNVTSSDASDVGEDWRASLLKAIEEVFKLDSDLLNAEIETLDSIPSVAEHSTDLITEKRKRLKAKNKQQAKVLSSLNNKDRESLLQEIERLKSNVEELDNEVETYRGLIEEKQAASSQREKDLTEEYQSQIDEQQAIGTQLQVKLDQEERRNSELETLIRNERNTLDDMKKSLKLGEEKIRDLLSALEIERSELKQAREAMTNEKSIVNQLSEEVKTEKKRSEKLQKHLEDERKNLEEICLKGKAKNDEQEEVKEKLKQVREERDRLIKDAELEQNHSRKVESLCEELKSTAAQEKDERQRMEKAAERYHANLEEIQKLLEAEKRRRIESEAALKERSSYQEEAKEKWQQDANTNEQLEVMLKDAKNTVEILERELDRTEAKVVSKDAEILSLQSESALKIAEIKKQNAERISEMSDIVAKSKHDFADEIERERASSRQLKEALNNLQLKFETSRSQYERLRQSFDELDGSRNEGANTPKSSPRNMHSSRVLNPFVNRCNKLVTHCQDVIVNEQQRMTYGADRPSERHIKELQSTHDALGALVQELHELEQDLRALEQADQCENSPIARLEQLHNKNEELRDHIRKLVKEKSEFRTNLAALEEQVMEYRNREAEIDATQKTSRESELKLKSEQLMWEAERNSLKSNLMKLEAERDALEKSLNMASMENENMRNSQSKPEPIVTPVGDDVSSVKESGWTIQKIQKLYGRCLRAESFRKALIYQKKYFLFLLGGFQETEAITLSMIAKMNDAATNVNGTTQTQPYGKSRAFMRFRTAARVVIATWRMKFLVRKWSKSVSKVALKSTKRDAGSNGSPSAPPESSPEKMVSSERSYTSRHTKESRDHGFGERFGDARRGRKYSKGSENKYGSTENGIERDYGEKEYEPRRGRNREHDKGKSRPRMERYEKVDTDSEPSSYAAMRGADRSPPRAYPRPTSPKRNRESPLGTDNENRYLNSRHSSRASPRSRSPNPQGASPGRKIDNSHQRSSSSSVSGLEDTNTSLNAYIRKLEMLQARLKSQGADQSGTDSRRF